MSTITIKASKTYDVIIESNILDRAGEYIKKVSQAETVVVVTDSVVRDLYAQRLEQQLKNHGFRTRIFTINSGEQSKNAKNYIELLETLADSGITRKDAIAALGGGVPGDLAGFAAATYMRGIGLIQIPTTLIAASDSSVGGKTAIDLTGGKNLAGAFYQPGLVLCDPRLMETLPERVLNSGYAEVVKYGMIDGPALFEKLRRGAELEQIIECCVEIKRDIVMEDERESSTRKILNFGHTIGHAVEQLSNYAVMHGEAVAIGMAIITRSAVRAGFCREARLTELTELLKTYNLPCTTSFTADQLAKAALSDKKRSGDLLTLVLPNDEGTCSLRDIPSASLRDFIALR